MLLFILVDDFKHIAHSGKESARILKISAFKIILPVDVFYVRCAVIHPKVKNARNGKDNQP